MDRYTFWVLMLQNDFETPFSFSFHPSRYLSELIILPIMIYLYWLNQNRVWTDILLVNSEDPATLSHCITGMNSILHHDSPWHAITIDEVAFAAVAVSDLDAGG